MKKIYATIGLLCMLFLVSCVNVNETTEGDENKVFDKLFSDKTSIKYFGYNTWVNDGGTLVDGLQLFSGLFFYDIENDTKLAVCNVPGCTHLEIDKDCYANTHSCLSNARAIYGDRIFYLEFDNANENKSVTRMCLIDRDGSNRVVLKEYEGGHIESQLSLLLVDEKLYIQLVQSDISVDEDGYVLCDKARYYVYEINMMNDNIKCIYEGEQCKGAVGVSELSFCDNQLIFTYQSQEKNYLDLGYSGKEYHEKMMELLSDPHYNEKFGIQYHTMVYNFTTGTIEDISKQTEKIVSEAGQYRVCWNGHLFFLKENKIVTYDLKSKKFEDYPNGIVSKDVYSMRVFDDFLLIEKHNENGKIQFFLIPPDSLDAYELDTNVEEGKQVYAIDDENHSYVAMELIPDEIIGQQVNLIDYVETIYMYKADFYARVIK